jgi:uncharacterized SAM-binding protein YcdF (DUF218 family)
MPLSFSSILAQLIVPLNLCLALLCVALVLILLRQRRTGLVLGALGLVWALAWSLPVTSLWLGGVLENRYAFKPAADLPDADAVVVLGGNTANDRLNWFMPYDREAVLRRFQRAEQLYQAGRAPLIVLSGGALEGDVSEAQGMAHQLRQAGVPESALILENSSRTTYENAALTEDELSDHHIRKVLLVTSALHMTRAMAVFRKLGIEAIPAPSMPQIVAPDEPYWWRWLPDDRAFIASRSIIKEYVALFVYWTRGWV